MSRDFDTESSDRDGVRLIIAGSRSLTSVSPFLDYGGRCVISRALEHDCQAPIVPGNIDTILCGEADGPDRWGEDWAHQQQGVDVEYYPPNYTRYDPSVAPLKRNTAMAESADAVLAFWDPVSRGTLDMITTADDRGLTVVVVPMGTRNQRQRHLPQC